jgi:hypothetical protein
VTSGHSGRANAAEKVSGMHNTAGGKTREVAAYSAISDRALMSLTHIHVYYYPLSDVGVQLFTAQNWLFREMQVEK